MGMGMPFSDDIITIMMGIDPSDPGMHGPIEEPCPSDDAVGLVTKIRDMCDEWLCSVGKSEGQHDKPDMASEVMADGGDE